jgi:hypothetical protein
MTATIVKAAAARDFVDESSRGPLRWAVPATPGFIDVA